MLARLCLLFLAALTTTVRAEELSFEAKDGRKYANVTLGTVQRYQVEVITANGIESIRVIDLPDDLQKRFIAEGKVVVPPKVGDKLSFTTTDGHGFSEAALRRIEPTGLTFETANGFEKVEISKLPKEVAAHFEFNDARYDRYRADEQARQRALAAHQAALAARLAAQQQAAASATPVPRPATPRPEPRLGDQGTRMLGAPRLGGQSLQR